MRREFLKELGIEDKDIINTILDENSADIGKAKGELETYKKRVADLEKEIGAVKDENATLQEKANTVNGLNEKISQLELDKTTLADELNTKVAQLQKNHETENKVRDRKAKNIKAVMALLDQNKDIDEQLDALVSGEDTSFLFGEAKASPVGTHVNNPPTSGNGGTPPANSFNEAVANALKQIK